MDDRAKALAEKRLKKIKAYQQVFSTKNGRAVLHDMMRAHGMLIPHPADPAKMALKEGERLVILRILTYLQTKPSELLERMNDANSED